MKIIFTLIAVFLSLLFGTIALLLFWGGIVSRSSATIQFFRSQTPKFFCDGVYEGRSSLSRTWKGIQCTGESASGLNIFTSGNTRILKYPFKTYLDKDKTRGQLTVLHLDYSKTASPFWAKLFHEEIVEIQPLTWSGRLLLHIAPRVYIPLSYYTLSKVF